LKLFLFSARKTSPRGLLAFNISVEKSAVILMGLPLFVICFFYLTAFSILSLVSVVVVLMIICRRVVLICSGLFGVLEASCTCMGIVFSDLESFCYYFIEYIRHSFYLHLLLLQCP
jgi:hypothetical protein